MLQAFEVTTKSKRNFLFHWSLYKWRFFVLISERLFFALHPFWKGVPLVFCYSFQLHYPNPCVATSRNTHQQKIHQRNNFHPPITPSECPYIWRELFGEHIFSERVVMNFLYEPLCSNYQKLLQEKVQYKNIFLVPHPNGHFVSLYIEGVFQEKNFLWGGYKKCDFLSI